MHSVCTTEWKIEIGCHGCSVAMVTSLKYLTKFNISLTSQYHVIHDMLLSQFWLSEGSGTFEKLKSNSQSQLSRLH